MAIDKYFLKSAVRTLRRIEKAERIRIEDGDNILNVYVSALPKSSYTIQLHKDNNELIGKELFSNERN